MNISEDGDATGLDIISMDAVITVTVEIVKKNVLGKDRVDTAKSVVASCDSFLGGDRAVDRTEIVQGSQTDTAIKLKPY